MAAPEDRQPEAGQPNESRAFRAGGEEWLVFACGQGVAGSDGFAGLAIQTLRFARADRPDWPVIEALTACRDPFDLFDDELVALLASGIRIDQDQATRLDRPDSGGRQTRGPGPEIDDEPQPPGA